MICQNNTSLGKETETQVTHAEVLAAQQTPKLLETQLVQREQNSSGKCFGNTSSQEKPKDKVGNYGRHGLQCNPWPRHSMNKDRALLQNEEKELSCSLDKGSTFEINQTSTCPNSASSPELEQNIPDSKLYKPFPAFCTRAEKKMHFEAPELRALSQFSGLKIRGSTNFMYAVHD